jgi:hypothetical protein
MNKKAWFLGTAVAGLAAVVAGVAYAASKGSSAGSNPNQNQSCPYCFSAGSMYAIEITVGGQTAPLNPSVSDAQKMLDDGAPGVFKVTGVVGGMSVSNGQTTYTVNVTCLKSADLTNNLLFRIGGGLVSVNVTYAGQA